MTSVRPGVPGHDDGTAFVQPRRRKLADSPSGRRAQGNTAEGLYEIVCPGCGDDPDRDWSEVSEELRRIRGIYATKRSAEDGIRTWKRERGGRLQSQARPSWVDHSGRGTRRAGTEPTFMSASRSAGGENVRSQAPQEISRFLDTWG